MRRLLFVLLAATAAGGVAYGAAATLVVNAGGIGAGSGAVNSCMGETALEVGFLLDEAGDVTGIRLENLAPACNNDAVSFSVSDDAETPEVLASGSGSVSPTAENDDFLFDEGDTVDPALIYNVDVAIGGIPPGPSASPSPPVSLPNP